MMSWISSTMRRNSGCRYSRGCGSVLTISLWMVPGFAPEDDDAVAEVDGLVDQVRDHEDRREPRRAVGPEAIDLGAQRLRRQDVERRERLVHAQQLGPAHERARDADALLHASGELLRERALDAGQAHTLDGARHTLARLLLGKRPAVQSDVHVLFDGQPRKEREVLENDGRSGMDAPAALLRAP